MTLTHAFLPICATVLLAASCGFAPDWDAPNDRWTVHGGYGQGNGLDSAPASIDADVDQLGAGLTYEGFAFERFNLALSVLYREWDGTADADFDAWIGRLQFRWHDEVLAGLAGYAGLGIGGAFSTDSPAATDYSADLYGDAELGLRWPLGDQWGLTVLGNVNYINAEDDAPSARSIEDPVAAFVAVGAWVDF